MKKILCMVVALLTISASVLFVGCGGSNSKSGDAPKANGDKVTLKIGFGSSLDGSAGGKGLQKFKELLEKESNGKFAVEIFADGQIGNDKSMMEALQMGTLDMTLPSTSPISEFTKAFLVYDLPFLFKSYEDADKVLDGANGKEILETLNKVNMIGLCYYENGFRNITNSKKAINSLEDLNGLKIRTMQNPVHLESFKLWGANPVPMAFNEVFTALEQKTLDGQENPNTLIYDAGFYEAQKYLTQSRHFYTPYVLMIGKQTWDKLSAEDQKLIQKCADESKKYEREVNRKLDKEYVDKMQAKGVQINTLGAEEVKKMQEAAKPVYDKFANEIGKERLDKILKELK